MNRFTTALAAGLATTLIATPILAQQGERPSRECVREIVDLCGRDRSKIRACLEQKFSQLSDKCSAEVQARMHNAAIANNAQQWRKPGRAVPADR